MSFLFHVSDSTPAGIGGIDEYTVLMMHMDGDQSDSQHVITHNGDPQFSTVESKFGGSSMRFDGSDYLTAPDSDDWFFSNAWTIDLWINRTAAIAGEYWVSQDQEEANRWMIGFENNNFGIQKKVASSWTTFTTPLTKTVGSWIHYAVCNDGSNCYLFENGVLKSTQGNFTIPNMTSDLFIGQAFTDWYYNGYMDEVRISDTARWTSDFSSSLPLAPYTSDANTKLLLLVIHN